MHRFKRILCVVEANQESVSIISRAALLARRNRAELKVVGTVDALPSSIGTAAGFPSADLREVILREARSEIDRLVESADTQGVAIETRLLAGTPFIEIIREVLRDRHDLVLLRAEGPRGLKQRLFGSTSMHLMRKCPCPVWAIKAAHTSFQRIMACVDPDPERTDSVRQALDEEVLQLATSLAKRESAEVHIVHAWFLFGEQMLRKRSPREHVDQWVEDCKKAHRVELDRLVAGFDFEGIVGDIHLVKGMPRDVLPAFAANHDVDLMVMGTVSRTGVAGLLIGNTAEVVLQQAECSVLAAKPEGFLTPVSL